MSGISRPRIPGGIDAGRSPLERGMARSDKVCMNSFFIVGPTASGKSALALQLAERMGAGICSVDAFQIYRGLDIGTGKATREEQAKVPHHLLDLAGPTDSFSVADYLRAAKKVLEQADPRRLLFWVGGTGLYARALREGLSPVPESDPERVKELSGWPLERLQSEVRRLDPKWCENADLQNPRRIIRALAVVLETGRPLSEWQQDREPALLPDARVLFLAPERAFGQELIAERVCNMWGAGWPEEVKGLLEIEGWRESQSAKAIGYLQIADYLAGKTGREECLQQIVLQTGQYAKRQMTWFRSEENAETIPLSRLEDVTNLGATLSSRWASQD